MARPGFCNERWFNDCNYPKCDCQPEDYQSEKRILDRYVVIYGLRWAGKNICVAWNEL